MSDWISARDYHYLQERDRAEAERRKEQRGPIPTALSFDEANPFNYVQNLSATAARLRRMITFRTGVYGNGTDGYFEHDYKAEATA